MAVNFFMDRPKDQARLTSFVGLAAGFIGLIYIFGWWISDAGKLARAFNDNALFGEVKSAFKLGRVLYFAYALGDIIALVVSGCSLTRESNDNSAYNQDFVPN